MDSISIVTPVYNDPRLERCLTSINAQTECPSIEIVVVDGESTDETTDVIESFSDDIDILIREPDDGLYDAMNKGIRQSSGDLIGVLNSDDQYNDKFVLRDVFEKIRRSGADGSYGDLVYVDEADDITRYWEAGEYRRWKLYFGWMPPHPTVFLRREAYELHGLFDTSLEIAADYELMIRMLLKGKIELAYLDRVLVRMSTGGKSNESITNIVQSNIEAYRSWRMNNLHGGGAVPILKPLRKIVQFVNHPK
jgi:glycosyltransferase involved in cell wall biosynthesis